MRLSLTLPTEAGQSWALIGVPARHPDPSRSGQHGMHWWLRRDGRTVAYAKTVGAVGSEADQLQDIEVRDDSRGTGLTRTMTTALRRVLPNLTTQGLHTPAGSRALAHLPLTPGFSEELYDGEARFVQDWDSRLPRYP